MELLNVQDIFLKSNFFLDFKFSSCWCKHKEHISQVQDSRSTCIVLIVVILLLIFLSYVGRGGGCSECTSKEQVSCCEV